MHVRVGEGKKAMGAARGPEDINNDLQKRVQELECLYRIGPELETEGDLGRTLRNSTAHLVREPAIP